MIDKVLLISPPYMQLSRPEFPVPSSLLRGIKYMNPGLLISSSILDEYNISNQIIKINDVNNITEIFKNIKNDKNTLIGLSCTCAWEYLESLEIARKVKQYAPNCKIFIAGWQIKSIKEQVFMDSLDVDYAVLGDAEYTLIPMIQNIAVKDIPGVISRCDSKDDTKSYPDIKFRVLDFSKYPEYLSYIPYVEESRNCPRKCSFCLNSCVMDRYQIVPIDIFIANVNSIEKLYGKNANAILLAANFGVSSKYTKEKLNFLKTKDLKWNMELHVDNPWEDYLDDLVPAGISKLSVGFESASDIMLKKMNKTQDPKRYLLRLEKLLAELNARNIQVSLNTLFDYRETEETMQQTLMFLEHNKGLYKAAKMNFMFGFEGLSTKILDFKYNILTSDYAKKIHAYPMLPNGFDITNMVKLIEDKEREFKSNMNQKIK